jgi:transcriptional regulator with XRE-family HTH domain
VLTIPGVLTHYPDELDLTRTDLAGRLGVSVRTIHNIEHGRKRVDRRLLERLATVLNEFARESPQQSIQFLSADNFVVDPESRLSVMLQTIAMNDCSQLFIGDRPIASADLRWSAPGDPLRLPFAGTFARTEIAKLYDRLHDSVDLLSLKNVRVLKDRTNLLVSVRFDAEFRHPVTGAGMDFRAYIHTEMKGMQIQSVESTYNIDRLAEFIQSGNVPQRRKSE